MPCRQSRVELSTMRVYDSIQYMMPCGATENRQRETRVRETRLRVRKTGNDLRESADRYADQERGKYVLVYIPVRDLA